MSSDTKVGKDSEKSKNDNEKPSALKEIISNELERLGVGGAWVWTLFLLCVTPNILNGFHVSSYVFLAHLPADMWCGIEDLKYTNWTTQQIRNITEYGLKSKGCTLWDWNYWELSKLSYEDALNYTHSNLKPSEISCLLKENAFYEYDDRVSSIVPEWNLVCENAVQRTSAQVFLSIGKFVGASTFGILSDKYGRRTSFILASVAYIAGSLITTAAPWYHIFLLGRFLLGTAASGLFYPAFALLTENISVKHRSWMSIMFCVSYPFGMLFLALAAYLVHPWKYLQLTLTIPGFLLILNCFLMFESPRWLLMKNRYSEAYKIVFKKKKDLELPNKKYAAIIYESKNNNEKQTIREKLKGCFKELGGLYGQPKIRRMVFTCYFMWCITSLTYYVTALNAGNLPVSRYLYVAITGFVDIPSYILPVILLRFMGRRHAACGMFIFAGIALLLVLAVPKDYSNLLVALAMAGRLGTSGVYSIVTLFTAELFPTQIRNSALGTCSTMAHIGSISAPYIVDILGLMGWFIPTTICGCLVLLAGILILTLPETSTRNLSDHVQEVTKE